LDVLNWDLSACDAGKGDCAISRGKVNPGGPANNLSYSSDGRFLWVETNSSITVWRPLDGTKISSSSEIPNLEGDSLVLSPDGTSFYLHRSLWKASDFSLLHALSQDLVTFTSASFSKDSQLLALSDGRKVLMFDVLSGQKLMELTGQSDASITQITFDKNQESFWVVTEDGTVEIWGIP